jgi:hypothetical protein
MTEVVAFNQTLEQELLSLARGVSLECLVCGEFVLHRGDAIACLECGSVLHGARGSASAQLELDAQAG